MKPEKPKKAKAAVKRTGASAKAKAKTPAKVAPKKALARPAPKKSATAPKRVAKAKVAPARPVAALPPAPIKPIDPPQPLKPAAKKMPAPPAPRPAASRRPLAVPAILREGDEPTGPRPSGPGQRYTLGSSATFSADTASVDLPEAYGTQRLLLIARDPHWLYANWDLTADQLRAHNAASRDGHLIVRVFRNQPSGQPLFEQHVHPESRNWFLHVGQGGTKYIAQLGYYDRANQWRTVATSGATVTPPDILSDDTTVRFETIPIEVPFAKLLEVVKAAVVEHVPLVEAIQELREAGHIELPEMSKWEPVQVEKLEAFAAPLPPPPAWTPQQERALAQVINIDEVRRVWMGSLEITELIRRKLENELASQAAAELGGGPAGAEQPGGISSISSPFGGEQPRKSFWFNINAELIIYGATEPNATVTIGGRRIQLRRDGTFSFRFALPDGKYDLPVQATSADGDDSRDAELHFRRATEIRGEVGQHPQDKKLKTPRAENVK